MRLAMAKSPVKKAKKKEESTGPPKEAEITDDLAIDKCGAVFGEQIVKEVKVRLDHLQQMCQKCEILDDDPKCGLLAQEALSSMAEYLSLPYVISRVLPMADKLKNVKNLASIWEWVASSLPQFGKRCLGQ